MSVGPATSGGAKSGRAKTIALWLASGLLACMFCLSGSMKFMNPEMAEHFAQWGYSDWFRILIGVVELAGGLLLLVPRTAFVGAGALGVVMAGAIFTHLRNGEGPHAVVPLVLLVALVLVGYARRPRAAS